MKRNDAEQIGKLIQQFLRQESLESPLNDKDCWMPGLKFWDRRRLIPAIFIFVIRHYTCI